MVPGRADPEPTSFETAGTELKIFEIAGTGTEDPATDGTIASLVESRIQICENGQGQLWIRENGWIRICELGIGFETRIRIQELWI